MACIENILAFKGGTNHKQKEGHASFDITVVVSCKCKAIIENRPFFFKTVCVVIWPELVKFQLSKCVKYTHKQGYMYKIMRSMGSKGDKL